MSKEMDFFIYLLEHYAESKGVSANEALREWDERGIVQDVADSYEMYHAERLENAFEDIGAMLPPGRHAW